MPNEDVTPTTDTNADAAAVALAAAQNSAPAIGKPGEGEGADSSKGLLGGQDAAGAEGKPTGEEGGGEANAGGADTGGEGYKDFTLPEGVTIDAEYLNELKATFKEAGLSQDAAQKLITQHSDRVSKTESQRVEAYDQLMKDWLTTAKSDKEIGGEAFDQSIASARLALQKFGTPELFKLFEEFGLGNHPELIRAFTRVGKLMKEDQPGNLSGSPSKAPPDRADILYPTS